MNSPGALPTWDEAGRPQGPVLAGVTPAMRATGAHLAAIHQMYREHLAQVHDVLGRVAAGALEIGAARGAVHAMGLRASYEQLGSFCGQACQMVEVHHTRPRSPTLRRTAVRMTPRAARISVGRGGWRRSDPCSATSRGCCPTSTTRRPSWATPSAATES